MKTPSANDWIPEKFDEWNRKNPFTLARATKLNVPTLQMFLQSGMERSKIKALIGLHLFKATAFNGMQVDIETMDVIADMILERFSFLKISDIYYVSVMARWGDLQIIKSGYGAIVINWVKQYAEMRANYLMKEQKREEGRLTLDQINPEIGIRLNEMLKKGKSNE